MSGDKEAVNPAKTGTKAAAHYVLDVPAGGSKVVRLRLRAKPPIMCLPISTKSLPTRLADADEFYHRITPASPE